jgi:cell division protein FtsA
MIPPRLKPLSARKSAILSVLDVGTSKIACLIARLMPLESSETVRGRTHRCRILGIGHQRSRGMKGGQIVDMEETEAAIRVAVDAAERMAGVQVESIIVAAAGGRLSGQHFKAEVDVIGGAVRDADIHRVLEASCARTSRQGRAVLHSLPTSYSLDAANDIRDPRGMMGERLGADLLVASCDTAVARNLLLAIERCHLGIEALVASPYASGLSVLVDDEPDMGTIVLDMGGGTTSIALFSGGGLAHLDAFAVGGHHITTDIARGLNARVADAERMKTLYGSAISSPSDERETITVEQSGDENSHPVHLPKSHLIRIIKPRAEEILELVRDRLDRAGFPAAAGRRIVLTGGGSQLTGLPEAARRILSGQVRLGRPVGIQGMPESAKSPGFAAAVGLTIYPQFAAMEHFEPNRQTNLRATGTDGYIARVGRWLKESF